jgi:hypothetical protein
MRGVRVGRSLRKGATLGLASLIAVAGFLAGLRLLAVELGVPPGLWLTEIRVFEPSRAALPVLSQAHFQLLENKLGDSQLLFAAYAYCQADIQAARRAGDFSALQLARQSCLQVLDKYVAETPVMPGAWLERARVLKALGQDRAAVSDSLRMSYLTGRRQGWVIPGRIEFALQNQAELPADLQTELRNEIALMTRSWTLARALADLYVRRPEYKDQIAEVVDTEADEAGKKRFVAVLEMILEGKDPDVTGPAVN